jgi:hypothetical protein
MWTKVERIIFYAAILGVIALVGAILMLNHRIDRIPSPTPIVSVSVQPAPTLSKTKDAVLGFCSDGEFVQPAYVLDGVIQCGSGYFVNVRPTAYKE